MLDDGGMILLIIISQSYFQPIAQAEKRMIKKHRTNSRLPTLFVLNLSYHVHYTDCFFFDLNMHLFSTDIFSIY